MSTNNVNIGAGRATGMFYTAPKGTELPTEFDSLTSWKEAGWISDDGMELALDKSIENIKNWAGKIVRTVMTEHEEKATGTALTTTEATLKDLFGDKNVTKSGTTIKVNLSDGDLAEVKAYLFVAKDGDDIIAFGCKEGQIVTSDSITFTPGEPIKFPFEITAQGNDGMQLIKVPGEA